MADTGNPKLKEIGIRIRALRKQRNWSIEALAYDAQLSVPQISEIERGLRDAQITTYMKIADAFGISLAMLLPREPGSELIEAELMEIHEEIKDMNPEKKAKCLTLLKSTASMIAEN